MLKFLLDENVSTSLPLLEQSLRDRGYDVVGQEAIAPGVPDLVVLDLATQQARTIITLDSDFSTHRFRDNYSIPHGVIFIERSKDPVRPDDALMTRNLLSAIEGIIALEASDPGCMNDTIFTLTQQNSYSMTHIRPKRYKDRKEVVTQSVYIEEQLSIEERVVAVSLPKGTETPVHEEMVEPES